MGDQHGGLKAVEQVLKRCKFNPIQDKIINLGDIVDGWPESAPLVQFWIDLQKLCEHPIIFIRGNHDYWCYKWLVWGETFIKDDPKTLRTRQSYIENNLINEEHEKFFRTQHNYYVDHKNRLFVHGGFVNKKGPKADSTDTLIWDRTLWQIALASKRIKDSKEVCKKFKLYKEIYIGHTATVNYKYKKKWFDDGPIGKSITTPMNSQNIWNMDTGAQYDGVLTVLDVDTKQYWQSDPLTQLYS